MGKKVNVQKGKQGFQKTNPTAVSPSPTGKENQGIFAKIFNKKNTEIPVQKSTAHVDALHAQYAEVREGLDDNVKCRFCGKTTLYKLMKEPNGEIVCQGCSRGGEGDNFIKAGPWLAPSPKEIRQAEKADKKADKTQDSHSSRNTASSSNEQLKDYAIMHNVTRKTTAANAQSAQRSSALTPPFTDTP
jgi:hypothetical protein